MSATEADATAIAALANRYAEVALRRDFGAWAACFTAGGVFITDGISAGRVDRFVPHEDVDRFAAIAGQYLDDAAEPVPMHITTMDVDVQGDVATARCEIEGSGHYEDRLVRTGDGWRFTERRWFEGPKRPA